ncbi:GNAT family N-acetyltransferase [Chthonobacter rhizosphaerae]|uniref:GNAT family N-acetyltransferase n=1 Tax=Chthonobacter rhizosphaerae TaxID=2735553 RepID=UPI0015EF5FA2
MPADLPAQPLPVNAFLNSLVIRPERSADADAVEGLHAAVFGPGRFARTAFRLREGVPHDPDFSLVAFKGEDLVGAVRLTPIRIGETPALLLGPLCVRPELKNLGVGKTLMRRSMEAARVAGHRLVLLVGDLSYYWPFGFRVVPPGAVEMPGPVDPARLLIAELVAGASEGLHGKARGGA